MTNDKFSHVHGLDWILIAPVEIVASDVCVVGLRGGLASLGGRGFERVSWSL